MATSVPAAMRAAKTAVTAMVMLGRTSLLGAWALAPPFVPRAWALGFINR